MVESTSTLTTKRRSRREVKRLLRPRGMKAELARRGHVSLSMVSHWIRGRAISSKLDRLAEELIQERGAA
jgi:DNA-binding transcriptional regulator YiaG